MGRLCTDAGGGPDFGPPDSRAQPESLAVTVRQPRRAPITLSVHT